jgi:hypothetical protein
MPVNLNSNTATAYYNSPYFVPGQYINMAPVNQNLPTQPIPKVSPFPYGDWATYQQYQHAVNAYRLYEVFGDHETSHTYVNTDDGAVITVTPNYVDARSVDLHHILYDRNTGAEEFYDSNRMLIIRPDNSVEADEYGNRVKTMPDGSVFASSAKTGMQQTFAPGTLDAQRDLVAQGYLSGSEAALFVQACYMHSLFSLLTVQTLFAQSAINALYSAKCYDAQLQPSQAVGQTQ